VKILTPKFDSS